MADGCRPSESSPGDGVGDEEIPAFLKLLQAAVQDRLRGKAEPHPSAREDSPFQVARTLARLAWTKKRTGASDR